MKLRFRVARKNGDIEALADVMRAIKNFFWNFMKWGLKGGISIDADSGPPMYVLWCCGGICHQLLNSFKIGCGHSVVGNMKKPGFHKRHWHCLETRPRPDYTLQNCLPSESMQTIEKMEDISTFT